MTAVVCHSATAVCCGS